nr:hypothetical protein [Tanacetum cinerariifolium]
MLPEESDIVEKYTGGLLDSIQGNVMSTQEVIKLEKDLMDQKCHFHHNRPYAAKCMNCKRVGHVARDCRSSTYDNNHRTLTCFECGNKWHYKSDFPKLKNQNYGNQAVSNEARGKVYALGGGEADQSPNNVQDAADA